MDLVVRSARPEDADAAAAVYVASAHHHCTLDPDLYRVPDVEVVAARYRERIPDADNESELLVADIDGQVAATCLVRLVGEPGDASMFIPGRVAEVDVAVLAAFRGHGLGRALIHQAERWAVQRGARRVMLDAHAANSEALGFYEHLGYRRFGVLLAKSLDGHTIA